MRIAFTLAAPPNFAKYRYQVVFNTTGNGLTPLASRNLAGYSYALEVSGNSGATVSAWEYLRSSNCATCVPAYVPLQTTASQLQYASGGAAAGFAILLARSVFTNTAPTWLFNAFTTDGKTGASIDSMGGGCAACFVSPQLAVSKAFQETIAAGRSKTKIDRAAKIVSIQVANEP